MKIENFPKHKCTLVTTEQQPKRNKMKKQMCNRCGKQPEYINGLCINCNKIVYGEIQLIDEESAKDEQLSNCCNAPVKVDSSDEGTHCYMCTKCNKPCDIKG